MSDETTNRILSDPQDPLPEANWLWRRVFIFAVTSVALFLVFRAVERLGDIALVRPDIGIAAFVNIVKLLVVTVNIMALYYMVAPSAEQITKLVKTASLLKAGVQIASRAVVKTDGQSEETQATLGLPPQPVVPPETAPATPVAEEEDFAPRSKP